MIDDTRRQVIRTAGFESFLPGEHFRVLLRRWSELQHRQLELCAENESHQHHVVARLLVVRTSTRFFVRFRMTDSFSVTKGFVS